MTGPGNRYAKRVDANQKEVVELLREYGCVVWVIGLPCDLLVGHTQAGLFLVECKTVKGKPTDVQRKLANDCAARELPYFVLREGESVTGLLEKAIKHRSLADKPPQSRRKR